MKLYQRQFIKFAISKQVLKFGNFTLKSGRISPYFFNTGLFNTGYDLALLGYFYAKVLVNSRVDFDLLFGPAYKGVPIVTTTAIALTKYRRNVLYCFNRKEIKDHGEKGNLIGGELRGNVMLVDDVITAGDAIRESVEIIQTNGAILSGVIVALDRQEKGYNNTSAIQQIEHDYNCQVISIFTLKDLIEYLEEQSDMPDYLEPIYQYQKEFGI